MNEYQKFLEGKQKKIIKSGFKVVESKLNPMLFNFQVFTIKRALLAGKYAIFADTGLGKTPMQLEIAKQVLLKTKKPVLILAPLAVTSQTIKEGEKFNVNVFKYKSEIKNRVYISNYEQLNNIDCSVFSGIILDESSILKNETGKYRNLIIDKFKNTPYKFCFTATPSPNDPMELGNHCMFLDVLSYNEMLAMYFVHDSGHTQKWRIKGHAVSKFWEFVSNWAIMYSHPKDIGFKTSGYDLPKLNIIEKQVKTEPLKGTFLSDKAVNATDYNCSLRATEKARIEKTILIINSIGFEDPIIIWTKQNLEAVNLFNQLSKLGYNCRNVQGADSPSKKETNLSGFSNGDFQILITKQEIASMGLNYQHCHFQIFNSVDFSFEKAYQAMRRSWRYGQKNEVTIWMVTTDKMTNIIPIQKEKQKQFETMQAQMNKAINKFTNNQSTRKVTKMEDVKTDNYWLMQGDAVERIKEVETASIPLIVFSPPFADLYTYSNYIEDMGNVVNYAQFVEQFEFIAKELKRVIKPGRIIAIHCMDLPTLKSRDGYIGIRRFSAMISDVFDTLGMFLHSEFTIWKDPLLAAVRTHTIGLAHQQLLKDSSIVRCGLPDKILCFKTKEENEIPIEKTVFTSYTPMHEFDTFPTTFTKFKKLTKFHNSKSEYSIEEQYSHQVWQRYASPVWMDIDQTDTLQKLSARSKEDEKHICPLQLGVIKRIILLYSNVGETILSPFGGIGSEGFQALKMGRNSISIELKESYFAINVKNHKIAKKRNQLKPLFTL